MTGTKRVNFFKTKQFWLHSGLIILSLFFLFFLVIKGLGLYTRHGEKIPIPKLNEVSLDLAESTADDAGFEIVVTDSLFIVGKRGGLVVAQNPVAGSFAKKGRKIYVTVTKFGADMVNISSLPTLYGKSFELKKKVLRDGYEINSEIAGYLFDKGAPDQILKVLIGKDTILDEDGMTGDHSIARGGTLRFILSTKSGGKIEIPDLICKSFDEALFLTNDNVGVAKRNSAGKYIISQEPSYTPGGMMNRGDTIYVELSDTRSPECPEDPAEDQ